MITLINISNFNYTNELIKNSNLFVNRSKKYYIKDIFRDYWEDFVKDNSHLYIRPAVFNNVEKMLTCQTPDLGYNFFECPNCDSFHILFNTCKSRFCNTCGIKYAKQRANAVSKVMLDIKHRHITFTIPDSIRHYFRRNRRLLYVLFEAVNQTMKWIAKKHSKKLNYQFGYVLTLHTFGRPLTFNPHIHALVTEGIIDKNGKLKHINYFNYKSLRKSFQMTLLNLLHKELGNSFYQEKTKLFKEHEEGFYVHGPAAKESKKYNSNEKIVNYVLRYTGRPVMAESRILNINYDTNEITYFYEPHEDDGVLEKDKKGTVFVTEHIYEFIKKLIMHISDDNFKTVRYYGFYSSKNKTLPKKWISRSKLNDIKKSSSWRVMIKESFNFDPLICKCGFTMKINLGSSYYPLRS